METICYMCYCEDRENKYWHEGDSVKFCQLFYGKSTPVHKVKITECFDKYSPYWAFWENNENKFVYVWPSKRQVDMCFPYGVKIAEEKERGKLCNVNIEFLEVAS